VLVVTLAGGTCATYLTDDDAPLLTRLAHGSCVALSALALLSFGSALALGAGVQAGLATALVVGLPLAVLAGTRPRERLWHDLAASLARARCFVRQPTAGSVLAVAASMFGGVLLWRIVSLAMFEPDGTIRTGTAHNYGDLAFHLAAISRFALGHNVPPEHPVFAGVPFTYPFLSDYLSALLVGMGATLRASVILPALVGVFALVVLLRQWTLDLTGDRLAAALAPVLVLLGGGLGWWTLVGEVAADPDGAWALLGNLRHDYSIDSPDPGVVPHRWGNLLTTLFIPQRGLQLAMPLAVVVFRQWWLATGPHAPAVADEARARRRMVGAGVVAGLLPLMHGHTYLVVIGMAVCLLVTLPPRKRWLEFLAVALLVGGPQLVWLAWGSATQGGSFVGWELGWDRRGANPVLFWMANAGLFIPAACVAVMWRGARPLLGDRLLRYYLPFTLCFVGPNLVRLAPWIWDNVKVLAYGFIATAPIVALLLARLWRQGRWWRPLVAASVIVLTLAGALDLWRVASGAAQVEVFDGASVEFARRMKDATGPTDVILHAPVHNHPVFLTGRRSLMGYPGHLWSQGLHYAAREADLVRMYAGADGAADLMARYQVGYVVVGPVERRIMHAEDATFAAHPVVVEAGHYRLYRVTTAGTRQ
jgi:hypothetical protein